MGAVLQLVEGILTIAGLVATRLGLAAHPFQLFPIEVVGPLNAGPRVVDALLALFQIIAEVAPIGVYRLVVEFHDDVAYAVEEESVVGHHEQRLVAPLQIALEPFYHLQVEMVGGLIQHQEVGFRDQHVGQSDALLLSAAELLHRLFEVGDVQLCEDLLCLEHALRVAVMIEAGIQHAVVGIEVGSLFQIAQLDVVAIDDAALLVSLFAIQNRHEGRFASAIFGYESHFLSFTDRERQVVEDNL